MGLLPVIRDRHHPKDDRMRHDEDLRHLRHLPELFPAVRDHVRFRLAGRGIRTFLPDAQDTSSVPGHLLTGADCLLLAQLQLTNADAHGMLEQLFRTEMREI